MNSDRITDWLKNAQSMLSPPGCETVFAAPPSPNQGCCTVGIVHEHRFAFYYWGCYSRDRTGPPPALISIDYHNDVGSPDDVLQDDLDSLNVNNDTELGLFTWLRLRSLNDGHILPALYLNFFSDVYILLPNREVPENFKIFYPELKQYDKNNIEHTIKFYQDSKNLLNEIPSDCPIFLDVDLDYFSVGNPNAEYVLGSETLRPDSEIRSFLSIDGPLIGPILNRIVGLTIGLEPRYCGGLINSLHVLNILNCELFRGTLCTNRCKWKEVGE